MSRAAAFAALFALSAVLVLSGPATVRAEDDLHQRVNVAIDKGVAWLKARPAKSGSFGVIGGDKNYSGGEDYYKYPQGPTAFALLTLLKCGVSPDDPVVKRGFAYLEARGRTPRTTYEIAILMLAIEARTNQVKRERKLEAMRRMRAKPGETVDVSVKLPARDHAWMKTLTQALLTKWDHGAWRYGLGVDIRGGPHDLSNTQMAMLALHSAVRCGIRVPSQTIQQTLLWTLEQQEKEGPEQERFAPWTDDRDYAPPVDHARGWAYIKGAEVEKERRVTGTMTTGGIIILVTGRDILRRQSSGHLKRLSSKIERGILDGLAWLSRNWTVGRNPPHGGYHFMYLYGLERVGDLLRVHLIGGHDWYREGAEYLVNRQVSDGRWFKDDTHRPYNLINTCFALLFLEKASLAVTTK